MIWPHRLTRLIAVLRIVLQVITLAEFYSRLATVYKGRHDYYALEYGEGEYLDSGMKGNVARFINRSFLFASFHLHQDLTMVFLGFDRRLRSQSEGSQVYHARRGGGRVRGRVLGDEEHRQRRGTLLRLQRELLSDTLCVHWKLTWMLRIAV